MTRPQRLALWVVYCAIMELLGIFGSDGEG